MKTKDQLNLIRTEGYKIFYFMFAQTFLVIIYFWLHGLRGYELDLPEILIFVIILLIAEQIIFSLHLFDVFTREQ